MRRAFLLILLAAGVAGAQNLAEPQYQLTGKDYSREAPAIQQMFYNVAGAVRQTNSNITAAGVSKIIAGTNVTISPSGGTGSVTINSSGGGAGETNTYGQDGSSKTFVNAVQVSSGGLTVIKGPISGVGISTGAAIAASLYGNGNNSLPLGVLSSSVAVLSGGFVLNNQLDPSSVTKQGFVTLANLSGAVPSSSIDGSTYTAAIALKAPLASPTFTGTVSGAAGVFSGTFTAGGFASAGSIMASSGTFTASGTAQYSVKASSGILLLAGDVCTASACLNSVSGGGGSLPAIDVVSSQTVVGAFTYSTPSPAPRQLYIQECAGGGGGGQGNSTGSNGNKGGATWFDGVVVSSGFGGLTYTGNYLQGGRGGYGGTNGGNITNVIRHPGQPGGAGAALLDNAAIGGSSWFGGGGEVNGNNQVGVAAQANSGGGGSGGEGSGVSGSGGGGGECAEFLINAPSGNYSGFLGDGGTDGGGAQPAGGKGGSGIVVIWARY